MSDLMGFPIIETDSFHIDPASISFGINGTYSYSFSFNPDAIYAHPDTFVDDIGDTYEGVAIHRDLSIPIGEIRLSDGTRMMILTYTST